MDGTNLIPADISSMTEVEKAVVTWLNTNTALPCQITKDYLSSEYGISLISQNGAQKTKQYILGGYEAEAVMLLFYRSSPSCDKERMEADELVNDICKWINDTAFPVVSDNIRIRRIQQMTAAAISARYDNGVEDHSCEIKIIYEVI